MTRVKFFLKYLLAIIFVFAGANHFYNPEFYLKIMPPYLPWRAFLVALSGFFEVGLGLMLLVPRLTRIAAWCLILLLIAVFPANIYMAANPNFFSEISPIFLWLRLPLQFVLIAWAFWFTKSE